MSGPPRSLWSDGVTGHARANSATVDWVCRKPEHRAAPSRGGRGGLTVYRSQWAYCDGATDDTQHDWAPTGGVGIDQLIDWAKALEPWRSRRVRP